nr:pentapeptide repeat-containing protein [Petrachloros mirabilis]
MKTYFWLAQGSLSLAIATLGTMPPALAQLRDLPILQPGIVMPDASIFPFALPQRQPGPLATSPLQRLRESNQCPGCNLQGANLRDASLTRADLRNADLRNADLRNADLRDANLAGATLTGAQLSGTIMPDGLVHP